MSRRQRGGAHDLAQFRAAHAFDRVQGNAPRLLDDLAVERGAG